jgi:hypothetical protein
MKRLYSWTLALTGKRREVSRTSIALNFCIEIKIETNGTIPNINFKNNYTNRSTPRNTTQPGLKLQHNKDFFLRREDAWDTNRQIKF